MPDAENFTPAFVTSFVTQCHQEGLTKEATVVLLEMTALAAAHRQPGFAAGFNERMSVGGLEKSAWATAAKIGVGALGLGAAGGAGFAISHGRNKLRDFRRESWSDVPLAGSYGDSPDRAVKQEQARLAQASRGVADLNRNAHKDNTRRAELQDLVNSNGPGAHSAVKELQALRNSPFQRQRDAYGRELDQYHGQVSDHLNTAQRDLDDVNQERDTWWGKTKKFVGLRDYDADEQRLVGQTSRLAEQSRLSEELRSRLSSGSTSFGSGTPLTQKDLQARFFPTR